MTPPSTTDPALVIRSLDYAYPGGRAVLRGVECTVQQGERLAIVGPSGAGKSTLLLHLNGLLPQTLPTDPVHARIHVGPAPLTASTVRAIRQQIGFVFQDPDDQLFAATVQEDVAFGPLQMGCSKAETLQRVDDALRMIGLPDVGPRHPGQLSYGERKRVCLAGVLACHPQFLVLDEPTSNLDPRARRQLAQILRDLALTVIIATHDLDFVLDVCHQVLVLDEGRVQAEGEPARVLSDSLLMERHGLEVPWRLR